VCKKPRKLYKFNRKLYRCFKKDPEAIRKTERVCGPGKYWDKKVFQCVQKLEVEKLEARISNEDERCEIGKLYQSVDKSRSKSKRRRAKRCKKIRFQHPKCNECISITKRTCKKLNRTWESKDSFC